MRFIKICLTLLALFGVERFCRAQTDGFRISKIHSGFVFHSEPTSFDPKILDQRFTFLGSGVQSYAFLGDDGKTVLKVFKHYHNFPLGGFWLPGFLHEMRQNILERRQKRLQAIFSSCVLAYQELHQETGLIGLHLSSTSSLNKKLILVDRLGIQHAVDADHTAFFLQKRAEMLSLDAQDAIMALFAVRWNKGIGNGDRHLARNIGFIQGKPIEIDVGSFYRASFQEIAEEKKHVQEWLNAHSL